MLNPGERVANRYVVERQLGRGGMGTVYLARDAHLDGLVALKEANAGQSFTPEAARAYLEKEGRTLARLKHPGVLQVLDVIQHQDAPLLVLEHVEGVSLRNRLAEDMPSQLRRSIATELTAAVAAAHVCQVVHRDLKPENVLLEHGRDVRVIDFGLATLLHGSASSSAPTSSVETPEAGVAGTMHYMAPEQLSGATVELRTDQYAVGLILYELFTGQRYFARDLSVSGVFAKQQRGVVPTELAALPPAIRLPIWRCLQTDAEDRYFDTRDLARDIREGLDDSHPSLSVGGPASGCEVVAQNDAVEVAAGVLVGGTGPRHVRIWGYGLSWANTIRAVLQDGKYPDITVSLFQPSFDALRVAVREARFRDSRFEANVQSAHSNAGKFQALVLEGRIGRLRVFEGKFIPSTLGVLVASEVLVVGHYGIEAAEAGVDLAPPHREDRRALLCRKFDRRGAHMIACYSRTLACDEQEFHVVADVQAERTALS